MTPTPTPERLYNVPEVAELLRVNSATVYKLIRERILPAVKIGRRLLVRPSALATFQADQTTTAPAALPGYDD